MGGLLERIEEHEALIQTFLRLSKNCSAMKAAKDPTSTISRDIVVLLNLKE